MVAVTKRNKPMSRHGETVACQNDSWKLWLLLIFLLPNSLSFWVLYFIRSAAKDNIQYLAQIS